MVALTTGLVVVVVVVVVVVDDQSLHWATAVVARAAKMTDFIFEVGVVQLKRVTEVCLGSIRNV